MESGYEGMRKKKMKRAKKVVQEYNEPSDRDVQLAKAYGGMAKGAPKRQMQKGIRNINSPSSSMSRQSKKLKVISGSVAGF